MRARFQRGVGGRLISRSPLVEAGARGPIGLYPSINGGVSTADAAHDPGGRLRGIFVALKLGAPEGVAFGRLPKKREPHIPILRAPKERKESPASSVKRGIAGDSDSSHGSYGHRITEFSAHSNSGFLRRCSVGFGLEDPPGPSRTSL